MSTPRAGKHDSRRSKLIFPLGVIAAVVALVALAFAAFAFALNNVFKGVGNIGLPARERLEPIPIAASACPYLREVHDKAESASRAYMGALSAQTGSRRWPTEAAEHAQDLAAFELTLRAAIPHVPARVATELRQVRAKVAAGRKDVAAAHSASEYVGLSWGHAADGATALQNASDLVGQACGFELWPSLFG
jgi:hypothetical protein